ncbi:Bug family tripartite tricarboxylate transporter substrate binding protein [Muricoccus radiodurans]|uniref:Bug family tripartite tricarboxylate transporter substrate binding protein n=1 Tax=Muricoccus radiodurans TaxID=2231721 RepID=UPI003CE72AE9
MIPSPMGRRLLLGAALALPAARVGAQSAIRGPDGWPNRPLRFIVPFAAGGNTDVTARLYADRMTPRLGQPIVVENRSGATGAIGTEAVARARPDGYTLLVGSPGSIVNGPLLTAQPRFNPMTDLIPVAMFGQVPMVIIVQARMPVRTLPELVGYSRERPNGVTIGTSGVGGANHLPLELFKAASGANLVHVPYRGGGATLADFAAGSLDGILIELPSVLDLHREGRGRILGVAAPARSAQLPDVPTFIEQGYADFLAASFVSLFAPAGTPEGILRALQQSVGEAAAEPDVLARLTSFGADPPTPPELTTPGLVTFLQGEMEKARRAIAIAGLRPE